MASIKLLHVNGFTDRYGQVRHYFRRRGHKAIRLPGLPGSEAFMAAYSAALGGLPDKVREIGVSRTLPGTINALIVSYYKSEGWQRLALETRKTRYRIIERFRVRHGDKRVATPTPRARRGHASGDQRALSETALAEDDPRAVAVRDPEHDQGQSS